MSATTAFDPLRESAVDAPAEALLAALDADGYLFLRGAIPREYVLAVRAAILGALGAAGWLATDEPGEVRPSPAARREEADLDPAFFDAYVAIQRIQALHELAHAPGLVAVMARLIGEPLLVHPRKIVRVGLPKDLYVVAAHQDLPLIQGTVDTLTAWIPLGACPDPMGGLRVLPGSHRDGLRPVRRNAKVGGLETAEPLGDGPGWRTADFEAGDVLVFHSLTVHAAKPNHTDELRLSCDFRYQSAREPVGEGSLLPHYYPHVPGHDELAAGWTSRAGVATPPDLVLALPFDPFDEPPPLRARLVVHR